MQRDVVVYRMRWPEEGEVGGVAVELAVGVAQSCLLPHDIFFVTR